MVRSVRANGFIGIRAWIGNGFKSKAEVKADEDQKFADINESRRARGLDPYPAPEDEESATAEAEAKKA